MNPEDVPPAWIGVAWDAYAKHGGAGGDDPSWSCLVHALAAVAPMIAKSERERLCAVMAEEVRCLGHLQNEMQGRIGGDAATKFFGVVGRAIDRMSTAIRDPAR